MIFVPSLPPFGLLWDFNCLPLRIPVALMNAFYSILFLRINVIMSDPISLLKEEYVDTGFATVNYTFTAEGPPHQRIHICNIRLENVLTRVLHILAAKGPTRKSAKHLAATNLLALMRKEACDCCESKATTCVVHQKNGTIELTLLPTVVDLAIKHWTYHVNYLDILRKKLDGKGEKLYYFFDDGKMEIRTSDHVGLFHHHDLETALQLAAREVLLRYSEAELAAAYGVKFHKHYQIADCLWCEDHDCPEPNSCGTPPLSEGEDEVDALSVSGNTLNLNCACLNANSSDEEHVDGPAYLEFDAWCDEHKILPKYETTQKSKKSWQVKVITELCEVEAKGNLESAALEGACVRAIRANRIKLLEKIAMSHESP